MPGDNSCWLATSANMLGAAGWGPGTNTAEQNAQAIYTNHLVPHFGKQFTGQVGLAVNWWLYNYGYNPGAGQWYEPMENYNDVTIGSINSPQVYDQLLQQLTDCQYIGLDLVTNAGDHAVTLVGGDPSQTPNGQVIIHDSDRNNTANPQDTYFNIHNPGSPFWQLQNYSPGTTNPNATVIGYTMICPGVQKPDSVMQNYDAAWHRDQSSETGALSKVWTVWDPNGYGSPAWDEQDKTILHVPNEPIPELHKEFYLLIDYDTSLFDPEAPGSAPDIDLQFFDPELDDMVLADDPEVLISDGGGQVRYYWSLPIQPPFEEILFPNTDYYNLTNEVKDFNIAFDCVPVLATVILMAIACAGLLKRRR